MRSKLIVILTLLAWTLTHSCPLTAQDLTEDLQGTFEKGVSAAEQSQWDLAIEYFSQVQKAAPKYTPVFFNLALAHQKAGHELPALAWFNAYLSHVPNAAEKNQIKKEILNLEVGLEAKFRNILKEALSLAQTLPVDGPNYAKPRQDAIGSVFFAYSRTGMLEEAKALLPSLQGSYFSEDYAMQNWIMALVGEGELDKAEALVEKVSGSTQISLFGQLMSHYANSGNLAKAQAYAARIPDDKFESEYSFPNFISKLAVAGQMPQAVAYLNKFTTPDKKLAAAMEATTLLVENKKLDDAKAMIALVKPLHEQAAAANPTGWDYNKFAELTAKLATGAAKVGDKKLAQTLVNSIDLSKLDSQMDWARLYVLRAYIELGDLKKAESIGLTIQDAYAKNSSFEDLFKACTDKKDLGCASKYIGQLKENGFNPFYIGSAYGDYAWLQLKAKDNAGFERTLASLPVRTLDGKADPELNRGAFFMQLCSLAEEANDKALYDAFYARITDNYSKAQVIRLSAYRLQQAGKIQEAGELLFKDMSVYEEGSSYHVLDSLGFDIVKGYLQAGDKVSAKSALDKMLDLASKENYDYNDVYGRLRELYLKLGDAAYAQKIQQDIDDSLWVSHAKAFAGDADLVNPDLYLKKIQTEAPEKIPGKMSDLAERYMKSLRTASKLASPKK